MANSDYNVTTNTANTSENAFQKLTREIHHMQMTGAIHSEWLKQPKGYLLKPDFKRKEQHMGAGGKKLLNAARALHFRLPGATYKSRWFVLDGMNLRYYRSETDEQEAGSIHLATVNAVLPSAVPDAPEHALDLVCGDRIYTVAATNREDMLRWATVLTQVLRGEYHPKHIRRRESAAIRTSLSSRSSNARYEDPIESPKKQAQIKDDADPEINEKIVTVTFEEPEKLYLILQGTVEDEVMVSGFSETPEGGEGPAEASGAIQIGDILIAVNDHYFTTINFQEAISEIKESLSSKLTLRFLRVKSSGASKTNKVAEGWVLAKEPAALRYRVRMLQLCGSRLSLYKPALLSGRQETPCATLSIEDASDIRQIHDQREISNEEIYCHSKQWGVSIQTSTTIFTFFPKTRRDMERWVDLLASHIPSSGNSKSICVHPLTVVEAEEEHHAEILLEGKHNIFVELNQAFEPRYFILRQGGKLWYYRDQQSMKVLGVIRMDRIVSIVPMENISAGDANRWQLNLVVIVQSSNQKFRHQYIIGFEDRNTMMSWGRLVESESKEISGRHFDLKVIKKTEEILEIRSLLLRRRQEHAIMCQKQENNIDYFSYYGFRHLNSLRTPQLSKDWFFCRTSDEVGLKGYHPRFVVLREHELILFKYEVFENLDDHLCTSIIDLRDIQDVREANVLSMDSYDFTIELVTRDHRIYKMVAQTHYQKEKWLGMLTWASDYFFLNDNTPERRTAQSPRKSLGQCKDKSGDLMDQYISMKGWVKVGGVSVFAVISRDMFSYYKSEEDVLDKWGDAIDAFTLKQLTNIRSDGFEDGSFTVTIKNEDTEFQIIAESNKKAKEWMLNMCSCGGLVLGAGEKPLTWESSEPKEGWIWKLDWLYRIYRRRFFSLRNDRLIISCKPEGRVLNIIQLASISKLELTQILGETHQPASFQMQIAVNISELSQNIRSRSSEDQDVHHYTLTFESLDALHEWSTAIFDIATDGSALTRPISLPPIEPIQELPSCLLMNVEFDNDAKKDIAVAEKKTNHHRQARGWMYYRRFPTQVGKSSRMRLRYFVLWGFELCIYKHEVELEEEKAVRYGLIDCQLLLNLEERHTHVPENAIVLVMQHHEIMIVPKTDDEQKMWYNALTEVRRVYGGKMDEAVSTNHVTPEEEEKRRRILIGSLVSHSGNVQVWDGSLWIPKFFSIISSRLVIFGAASHLYDEESDALGSFLIKTIAKIHSTQQGEARFEIILCNGTVMDLKCDTEDASLQWMRQLCSRHGKLDLQKNATTGLWGSVNRIEKMSRHKSFMATNVHHISSKTSRRVRSTRRTSELINIRKLSGI